MEQPDVLQTIKDIDRAIEKLRRRVADLQSFAKLGALDAEDVVFHVGRVEASVKKTIAEIYGPKSRTAREFASFQIAERAPKEVKSSKPGELDGWIKVFAAQAPNPRVTRAAARLQRLIAGLEESRLDFAARSGSTSLAQRNLNRSVVRAASKLFGDGHYADAVFAASKVLIELVKKRSGRPDLDGVTLMRIVFTPQKPILRFNGLETATDKDEQEGMMNLYVAAVQAIRNPRGHASTVTDTRDRAIQYLELISLLADRLAETS